jgi:hypothetical protein
MGEGQFLPMKPQILKEIIVQMPSQGNVAHLARSLFANRSHRRVVMGMLATNRFTCHWDESGIDPGTGTKSKSDKDLLVVAGYFAHVDEWKAFEKKWEPTVKAANLPYFHMVDFANGNPPYRNWDEPRRNRFIDRLLHIIGNT